MKIALVQINPIIGDFSYNSGKIISWANKAREKGCDLAVFSELAPSKWVKNLKAFQSSPHISLGVKCALKMKLSC